VTDTVTPPLAEGGTIRALIIDDNPLDAGLSLFALKRAGIHVESIMAEDEVQLRAALRAFVPDVVLCDFSFPNFDGLVAQRIVHDAFPNCPLIFVSGTISEDRAALALRSGAVDYVMKSSLSRLPSSVRRAIAGAREAARIAERRRWHQQRLEALWRTANDPALRGVLSHAMLNRAALDVSPAQTFVGFVARHRSGETVVLQKSGSDGADFATAAERLALAMLGMSVPTAPGGIRSWPDTRQAADASPDLVAAGWRAVMCASFDTDDGAYSLVFASAEPAPAAFGDDDAAYLNVLAASFATHVRVAALEASLRDEKELLRQHALRLEAAWKIVNDASSSDAAKRTAMLTQAAGSIRPGEGFRGTLWRINGDYMTCEAIGEAAGHQLSAGFVEVGSCFAVATSVVGLARAAGGGSRSWSDVRASEPQLDFSNGQGTRSCIVTTFDAGNSTWALTFASGSPAVRPFGVLEHAYIDVLTSVFSNHVQQRWQHDRLQYQQSHDLLTGLFNRSRFLNESRTAAQTADAYAVAIIDVNAFHEINESFGHTAGDAVLIDVGTALLERALPAEIVGRLGGDVFSVFMGPVLSAAAVLVRVKAFADIFVRAFATGERENDIAIARTACFGIALAAAGDTAVEITLSHADAALVVAKERGHGSIVLYEDGMEDGARDRATFRNELAEAIQQDEFTLYYQPHVEAQTGRVVGCEALIRWNHPQRGLVMPGSFIPFAERAGVIGAIDKWVMQRALATAATLSESRPDFRMYFNLSGRQAGDPAVIHAFVDAARAGVPLGNIGVEITESDAMRDVEATRRVCRTLRRLNVRVAIDDFGTGYSSLSSLKALPVDIVKIDRTFVSGVTTSVDDAAIAEAIISISDHFGFASLGEGAETLEEVEWLRSHGCRYVQGYAIGYPLPLAEFQAWLAGHDAEQAG
jgi:diguanylate cyclase (GGDEF)-like protein